MNVEELKRSRERFQSEYDKCLLDVIRFTERGNKSRQRGTPYSLLRAQYHYDVAVYYAKEAKRMSSEIFFIDRALEMLTEEQA